MLIQNSVERKKFIRFQVVGATGKLVCGRNPSARTQVLLTDHLSYGLKILDRIRSNSNGSFSIRGSERKILPIVPYVEIIHSCLLRSQRCRKIKSLRIPFKYVYRSKVVRIFYNFHTINLADFRNQRLKCFRKK
uniref:Transthyretin-like family protein n=1 Tax=Strongyloides venezuelensis TaxID=75913 RepID=A0A0K0FJA3_STRVS